MQLLCSPHTQLRAFSQQLFHRYKLCSWMFTVAVLFIALQILIAQRMKILDGEQLASLSLLTASFVVQSEFYPERFFRFCCCSFYWSHCQHILHILVWYHGLVCRVQQLVLSGVTVSLIKGKLSHCAISVRFSTMNCQSCQQHSL